MRLIAILFGLCFLCAGCEQATKPTPGSGELSWFLIDQLPRYGGRVTLASPPVLITTNWSYRVHRDNLEVQVSSKSFYDMWRFLRQLYDAPASVQEDTGGYRRGVFQDKSTGLKVEISDGTNGVVAVFRKAGS